MNDSQMNVRSCVQINGSASNSISLQTIFPDLSLFEVVARIGTKERGTKERGTRAIYLSLSYKQENDGFLSPFSKPRIHIQTLHVTETRHDSQAWWACWRLGVHVHWQRSLQQLPLLHLCCPADPCAISYDGVWLSSGLALWRICAELSHMGTGAYRWCVCIRPT